MAGAEAVSDLRIVLGADVLVLDEKRDRGAGGEPLEHAGEDAHPVGLAALGGEARLAGTAAVEIGLDVGLGERDAGRAAVDHAADRRAVALAERGDAEEMAETVVRHRAPQSPATAMSGAAGFFMPTM